MARIRKTRFRAPYLKNGRTAFPARGRAGVYLIKVNGRLRYVGRSAGDVYKAMYRHFQSWQDKRQARVSYAWHLQRPDRYSITCRVVYCTAAKAAQLERALILKHQPPDNPDKLELFKPTAAEQKRLQQIVKEYDASHLEPAPF